MSESAGHSSAESGDILDWALVDRHGDLEDGDTSSTTSSVEVMAEEEVPRSESLTGSSTGPKFVLRLASREHLGPDSDEDTSNGLTATGTASFDVIPSASTASQGGGPYSSSPTLSPRDSVGPGLRQQVSREDIEQLVQAITEVQSSVTKTERQATKQSPDGSTRSLFGNNIAQESHVTQDDTDTESLAASNGSRFSFLSRQPESQGTEAENRSRSLLDCDAVSMESSVSSRFSFLTRGRGDLADFDDDSLPVVETLLPHGNQDIREPGTCSILYRAPQAPVCGQPDASETDEPPIPTRQDDSILSTIKLLDKLFNISIIAVVVVVVVMFCSHKFSGPAGQTKIVDDEINLLKSQKADAQKLIAELRDDLLHQNNMESDLRHKNYVAVNRLEKSLKKCKINLNDAEVENSDLKSEVIRLKYSIQHVQETAGKREPEESRVANGDTPYIQCGPGKVMKRHHEEDGDTMYFCDLDKSQGVQEGENKETPPGDADLLVVEGFCEKILGEDEGRETSRKYRKLKKSFKPLCRKVLKQEDPDQPVANQQPVEDNTIPCQSCYQKLSEAENHWLNAVNEKEAAVSRAELWKELYTRAIEREAETSKNEEEPEASKGEQGDSSGEPVSLNSCWKFVLSNLTAGNHLFQSFGLYWEEVENLMPTNFSSLFDFWIHSKWRKPPQDTYWQEYNKDEEPEMFTNPGSEGEGPWTGSDSSEGTEGQLDWADTVNSVLNKTKESVTTVNKQIQDTWKQVKNMSKHLWDKHEPTLLKMHNTFTEKISRLGEQFQEKLKKKTQHWFNRLNKKFKKNEDSDNKGPRQHGPINKKGKQKKGCKPKAEKGGKKQGKGVNNKNGDNLKNQNSEGQKGKGEKCKKSMDKIGGKQNKNDKKMKRKGELEEGTGGRVWREPLNKHVGHGAAGKTKQRQDVYSGVANVKDKEDREKIPVLVVPFQSSQEKGFVVKDRVPSCKFPKLKKAAQSLKWRTNNIDAWDNLAEEFRVIADRLVMNDVYQEEEELPSDLQSWYDCQLTWWHNNLQGGRAQAPDHCTHRLEPFQRNRKVVDPKQWRNQRISDDADLKKDVCFYEKLEILYSLLQNKLDLFQIDMCRHRVPPCTYREHLYMNMDELRELFQDSDAGFQSSKGTNLQNNWLFERAEHREHLRENLDDDDNEDDNDDDDDDVDNDLKNVDDDVGSGFKFVNGRYQMNVAYGDNDKYQKNDDGDVDNNNDDDDNEDDDSIEGKPFWNSKYKWPNNANEKFLDSSNDDAIDDDAFVEDDDYEYLDL